MADSGRDDILSSTTQSDQVAACSGNAAGRSERTNQCGRSNYARRATTWQRHRLRTAIIGRADDDDGYQAPKRPAPTRIATERRPPPLVVSRLRVHNDRMFVPRDDASLPAAA